MSGKTTAIFELIRGQWRIYAASTAALIAASGFLYAAPLVIQVTIDGVVAAGEPTPFVARTVEALGGRDFLAGNLWLPAVLFVALTALAGALTYLRARWSARASETIARQVRERAFDHLQHMPCAYFDGAETGDLLQRCTSDVETLRVFLSTQVVEIGRAVVMLAVPIPIFLAIDVGMTVASLALIPPVLGFALLCYRRIRNAFQASDEAEARLTSTVQENLTGIRVVRAFARQEHECARFAQRNADHRARDHRVYVELAWYWSVSELLCFMQKGLVLGVGVYLLATGRLPVGAFFYFLTAAAMFIWPVRMVGRILADLGKATVAMKRLNEILAQSREADPATPAALPAPRGEIVFDRVSFAHEESSPVLRDVSLRVAPGQT
ncbi:MAG: ABC transporter transmembrane domain-containing protein, partial [Planctomycetota bacterium]